MAYPDAPRFGQFAGAVVSAAAIAISAYACSAGNEDPRVSLPSTTIGVPTATTLPPSEIGGEYDIAEQIVWRGKHSGDFTGASEAIAAITRPDIRAQAAQALDLARSEVAAWGAYYKNNPEDAEKLVDTIGDPAIRREAEVAVDWAEAENAAWEAWENDNFERALAIASLVEDGEIRAQVEKAIALARLENDLWNQTPKDTKAWSDAQAAAGATWDRLYGQEKKSWDALYRRSDQAWGNIYRHTTAANSKGAPPNSAPR